MTTNWKNLVLAGLTLCSMGTAQIIGPGWPGPQPIPAPAWQANQPMLTARWATSAATGPDGKVYAVGGYDPAFDLLGAVEQFDPLTNTWKAVANLITPRAFHATVTGCDGKIYAIGGLVGGPFPFGTATDSVEVYDPGTNKWAAATPLPTKRAYVAAAVGSNCNIYAIASDANESPGPDWSSSIGNNAVEVFSPTTLTWTSGTLPSGHNGSGGGIYAAVGTHDGHIWALGGNTEFEFDGSTWLDRGLNNPDLQVGGAFASTLGGDGKTYVMKAGYFGGGLQTKTGIYLSAVQTPALSSQQLGFFGLFAWAAAAPAVATAEGRQFALGKMSSDVGSYGPIPARVGPYKLWWTFDGYPSEVSAGCPTTGPAPGPATYVSGRVAPDWFAPLYGALSLSGSQSLSAAANCSDLGSGPFSIEFWMRQDGTVGSLQSILDKRWLGSGANGYGYYGYHVFLYQGKIGLQMGTGPYANYVSSLAIPVNQWTHVAITVNRQTDGGRIWVNGVQAAQFTPLNGNLTNNGQAYLNIGGHNFGAGFFKGQLDELTIYDKALTWAEVRSVFLAGKQGKQ